MVTEIQYTNIRRVLDNLKDDPIMASLTLEQAVRYTIRFIEKNGFPRLYQDKQEDVEIHAFRGILPCDLISIIQVKDCRTGICLRSMTDSFTKGLTKPPMMHRGPEPRKDGTIGVDPLYIPPRFEHPEELAFKTQGRVIFTSFPEGKVRIAYKAVPIDEDGFPLLIDNEVYLDALEAYITYLVYRQEFRSGKITPAIFQDVKQAYAVAVKLLETEMTTPSVSEMESITRMWNTLIPRVRQFDNGFVNLGDREYLRNN